VTLNNTTFNPGQGNNAYIFPGVALAVIAVEIRRIPESIFLEAAKVSIISIILDAKYMNAFYLTQAGEHLENFLKNCVPEPGIEPMFRSFAGIGD
jgi:malic enzyme